MVPEMGRHGACRGDAPCRPGGGRPALVGMSCGRPRHVVAESFGLVFPMEDLHIAGGNAEAVDGLHGPEASGFGCSVGPVVDALLFAGRDRGFEIGGFDAINVDGALAAGLPAEDGERRNRRDGGPVDDEAGWR